MIDRFFYKFLELLTMPLIRLIIGLLHQDANVKIKKNER